MKIYDLVKDILVEDRGCRNSDKKLIWEVYIRTGFANETVLYKSEFLRGASPESITRARRKVQENNSYLKADRAIETARKDKADHWKGYHPYHEDTQGRLV